MDKNRVKNGTMPITPFTKKSHRQEILKRIENVDWAIVSIQINHQLQTYFKDQSSLIIAGFTQHKDEPDILPFLRFWQQKGGTCCLPVVVASDQPLIFRVWDLEKPLVKGSYGIWVPAETESESIPDVVLTPLVSFDRQGSRLGRGAGHYDRTIKALRNNNKKPLVIGVAIHQQFIEFLETEPHDEPLDGVVTDKEILRFRELRSVIN